MVFFQLLSSHSTKTNGCLPTLSILSSWMFYQADSPLKLSYGPACVELCRASDYFPFEFPLIKILMGVKSKKTKGLLYLQNSLLSKEVL